MFLILNDLKHHITNSCSSGESINTSMSRFISLRPSKTFHWTLDPPTGRWSRKIPPPGSKEKTSLCSNPLLPFALADRAIHALLPVNTDRGLPFDADDGDDDVCLSSDSKLSIEYDSGDYLLYNLTNNPKRSDSSEQSFGSFRR
jgi:hypothetical protein